MKYDKMTKEQKLKNQKYKKENIKQFKIELHKARDTELISLLESQKNKQGFIKALLKNYLEAH